MWILASHNDNFGKLKKDDSKIMKVAMMLLMVEQGRYYSPTVYARLPTSLIIKYIFLLSSAISNPKGFSLSVNAA